jgi:adenylyltransferase/sulfurtransferase
MHENHNAAEISPQELKKKIDAGKSPAILDVREPKELEIAKLAGAVHIPMGELPLRLIELEDFRNKELVVICRSGGRSGRCVEFLRMSGFKQALNLTGGLLAWSDDVDPKMQKY